MDFDTANYQRKKRLSFEKTKPKKYFEGNCAKVDKKNKEKLFEEDYKGPMHKDHFPATVGMLGMVIAFGLLGLKISLSAFGLVGYEKSGEILIVEEDKVGEKDWQLVKEKESREKEVFDERLIFFRNNFFKEENNEEIDINKNGKIELEDYYLIIKEKELEMDKGNFEN